MEILHKKKMISAIKDSVVLDLRDREARQKRKLRLCAVGTLATIFALCIMAGAALGIVAPGMWRNVVTAIEGTNRAKGESDAVRFVAQRASDAVWGRGSSLRRGEEGMTLRPLRCV